jgi:hypothetical protein
LNSQNLLYQTLDDVATDFRSKVFFTSLPNRDVPTISPVPGDVARDHVSGEAYVDTHWCFIALMAETKLTFFGDFPTKTIPVTLSDLKENQPFTGTQLLLTLWPPQPVEANLELR